MPSSDIDKLTDQLRAEQLAEQVGRVLCGHDDAACFCTSKTAYHGVCLTCSVAGCGRDSVTDPCRITGYLDPTRG